MTRIANGSTTGPPPGAPWDDPIGRASFAFVDLEMSGLDRDRDHVLQVCIERTRGTALEDRLASYVNPGRPLDGGGVHGIRQEDVAGAPRFADLVPRIEELLAGAVFVAHAAEYDVAFLRAELARVGKSYSCPHRLDTLQLSRRAFNFRSHRLPTLASELGIANPTPHRADNDVRVLREVFARLVGVLRPSTPRDLWHVRAGVVHPRPEIIAGLERALASGEPVRLKYRPSGRSAHEMLFHVTALRTELDPPMAIGYLSHTRGRRELRIDRILSLEQLGSGSQSP